MYNFTELAVQLNEPEDGVAPTDTRMRPDQRLMEEGKWDDANREKLRLEEKQRAARKLREAQMANANSNSNENESSSIGGGETSNSSSSATHAPSDHNPLWFKKTIDPYTNQPIHLYQNEYWNCKERKDWKRCPDIY